tara:strand:+ start:1994 stop:2653 length:660 start_codon:yes stop_codon:yes gene_type:complete
MKGNLKLTKKIYGVKGALEKLDEEFEEFALKNLNPKEFFVLYNRFFYNMKKNIHDYFITKSTEYVYPGGYVNPRSIDVQDLNKQITDTKFDILNVELHHFYFKNGIIMMDQQYASDPDPELIAGTGNIFYVQSGRKRSIRDYQTYVNLKMRKRKGLGDINNKDFITFLSTPTLSGMPTGPDIHTLDDIFIPISTINMYPKTPGSNDPEFQSETQQPTMG